MRTEGVNHAKISDKALQTERTASTEILKPAEEALGIRGTEAQPVWLELNGLAERRTGKATELGSEPYRRARGRNGEPIPNEKSWRVY